MKVWRAWAPLAALLGAAPLLEPRHYLLALADEQSAEGDDTAEAAAEATSGEEGAGDAAEKPEGEVNEEDAKKFVSSAKELKDKLGQLRELLATKGEASLGGDLQDRLKSLEKSLGALGLDESNPEMEMVSSCVAMAMRRSGFQRPSTIGALRRLATEETTLEDVKDTEMMRMITVCLNDLTEDQLKGHLGGKIPMLPKAMAAKAAQPEISEMVVSLEPELWKEVQDVSRTLLDEVMKENATQLPVWYGVLAGVPVLAAAAFLGKKFKDMQEDQATKKDKGKKKSK